MKPQATPRVRLQADSRPDLTAQRVEPVRNPNANVAAQLGESLVEAGGTAVRAAEVLQLRADRARAKEADAKLADGYRTLLTSPKGYRNHLGRDAIDHHKDIVAAIDQHRQSILGTLSPQQRELLAESDSARYQQARNAIDGHYTEQLSAYEMAETEARADALMHDAFEGYFLPQGPTKKTDPFKDNRVAMLNEVATLARQRGLGPAATKAAMEKADEQLHGTVVSRLISEKRSTEAADFLQQFGGRLSEDARSKLARYVADGGVKEQGQQVSEWVSRTARTPLDQVAMLNSFREHLPIDVFDEAQQRLLHSMDVQNKLRDREAEAALKEARLWKSAPANRGSSLPEDMRERLRAAGEEATFDLWDSVDGDVTTTPRGREAMRMEEGKLAQFESADALFRAYGVDLSREDFDQLQNKWRRSRGELLNPKDAFTLDMSMQAQNFLHSKNYFEDSKKLDDGEQSRRVKQFVQAAMLRANQLSGGKETNNALQEQAIAETYANGVVIDGKWLPVSMTNDEQRRSAKLATSYEGWMSGTAKTVEPGTMSGLPLPKEMRATQRLVSGELMSFAGDIGDKAPTRDQILAKIHSENELLVKMGLEPVPVTEPLITSTMLEWDANQRRAASDVTKAASVQNKLNARKLLEGLDNEVTATFGRKWATAVKNAAEGKRLDKLINENTLGATKLFTGVSATPEPDMKEVWRASLVDVLDKHRDSLVRYGIAEADAVAWVPGAASVLPKDDPLRSKVAYQKQGLQIGGTVGAPPIMRKVPGEKVDPSPSAEDLRMLEDLRKRYVKTRPEAKK